MNEAPYEATMENELDEVSGSPYPKGQIILKGLFGIVEFSQKTNERIRRSSKNEFVCSFFWENSRIPKVLSKLSDL